MSTAWLGLGSNQNAQANLRAGLAALYRRFDHLAVSPVYRSPAVGFSGQDFLNCAARISTDLSPVQLKQWLTDLEDAHGRDRSRSEEHTSELQSRGHLVCRLLLEKKKERTKQRDKSRT